jgi:exopolysaccharide production protein ExoZ
MFVESKRLDNIQVLRAVAALMVCAFHLQYLFMDNGNIKPFANGEMGVQVFFIISGLIMYHTTRDKDGNPTKSPWVFGWNRLVRIVPLYLFVTFVYVADDLSWAFLSEQSDRIWKTILFFPPMTDTIGPKYGYPLLDVGWTLNYEMFFYLLFFCSLFFGKLGYKVLFLIFLCFGIILPLLFNGNFHPGYVAYYNYPIAALNLFCNPMVLLFASGVLLGDIMNRVQFSQNICLFGFTFSTGLFLMHVLGWHGLEVNLFTDLAFIWPWVFFTALCDRSGVFVFASKKWISVGDCSYSLYLWHPVVFAYLRLVAEKFSWPYLDAPWISFVVGMVLAIVVASISYKFFETKVNLALKSLRISWNNQAPL